ncbi:OmpA family protein [Desulfobacterales bacterium HSG16]|nr:OmpA family protein [Desulfobacterales bacterium HSG16]
MKKMKVVALVLIAFVVAAFFGTAAFAQIKPGSFNMSHLGGYYLFEGNQDRDNGPTYMGTLGYNITEKFGFEMAYNYVDTESEIRGGDDEAHMLRLDGIYHFMPENRLVPYLSAGLGSTSLHDDGKDYGPFFNMGGGFKYFFTDRVAFRGDIRHILDMPHTYNNLSATLGLSFVIGGDTVDKNKDSDGDGVYDHKDQCPGTPPGVKVDAVGCPEEIKAEVTPTTPVEPIEVEPAPFIEEAPVVVAPVEETPTEPIPDTPTVEKIEVVVEFEYDRTIIRPVYNSQLKAVADFMERHPNSVASIEGHTDSRGSESYNMSLSRRRAVVIKRYLMNNHHVASKRFKLYWYGESRPVADNDTNEGRERNRRSIIISISE